MSEGSTPRAFAALLSLAVVLTLVVAGGTAAADADVAAAGESVVEVTLPSKGDALVLQATAERYGVEFNDHYLRRNANGTVTVVVIGGAQGLANLEAGGYELGHVIEGPAEWRENMAERQAAIRKEERAEAAALGELGAMSHTNELVVLRADYFENYAGRFLSVEAKTRQGRALPGGPGNPSGYDPTSPTLELAWNSGPGTPIDSTPPRIMDVNIDPDTTPDTYIEHRELVRIGDAGTTSPPRPSRIRIGSSTGQSIEADVTTWLGEGLPPSAPGFRTDFTTRYMDPTEVLAQLTALAAEHPHISSLVPLPHKTNGYQRRAQANMAGTTAPGSAVPTDLQAGAVVLTSRAWGHEGGNEITAEFRDPGAASSLLSVSVTGTDIVVSLGTDATGAVTSTAAEVVAALNADPAASALVVATTYRGDPGAGVVLPRARVNLSDFLTSIDPMTGAVRNAHVQRGPFQNYVLRIGRPSSTPKVGVFLYCQQHAREWATPLTCLETASRLLVNYAIDPLTRELVDNLDIFILASSNPDGGHYSLYNFTQQRRNLTNYCVEVGGHETDDPFAPNFWAPRTNPATGLPFTNTDPASRNAWGVDLNRNNTFATLFDGYIGASTSCTSDVFAGPAEASEPEIRNELWVADTFSNIKFSNNIHSFGGYFMWGPGAYLPNRDEGAAVHPNIGIEKYFFEAGERILTRIKQHRNTVILPERTGPIADVLYSAAGNSADEHWYNRQVIAYSFETGADRFVPTSLSTPAAAGDTGIRLANRGGFSPGDRITIDSGASQEVRVVAAVAEVNPPTPSPNVTLTEPLALAHAAGAVVEGGTTQAGVGFQPDYATEGKHEALEFSNGNYGLLESALAYARDTTPPQVDMTGPRASRTPIETTFRFVNEPSVIHYTTDGSAPTTASPEWDATGPREPGQTFHITSTTTFRWLATDIKGNTSTGSARFAIDTTAPVTTATVDQRPGAGFASVTLRADDAVASGGAGVASTQYRVDGGPWTTYANTFAVFGVGAHTVEFYSTDLAGNVEPTKQVTFEITRARRVSCNVRVLGRRIRAQTRARVRALVKLYGRAYPGARVTFRGPGFRRTDTTNARGIASVRVYAARAGRVRARVRADDRTLGCAASRRILPARRAR